MNLDSYRGTGQALNSRNAIGTNTTSDGIISGNASTGGYKKVKGHGGAGHKRSKSQGISLIFRSILVHMSQMSKSINVMGGRQNTHASIGG
jgi:hypothetical protein